MNDLLAWLSGGSQQYMPRIHCMHHDWATISILIALCAGVVFAYGAIIAIWAGYERHHAVGEGMDRGVRALRDLRYIFALCLVCGYGFFVLAMWWPAYRLLAIFLLALNVVAWRFVARSRHLELVYVDRSELVDLKVQLEKTELALHDAEKQSQKDREERLALEARLSELRATRRALIQTHQREIVNLGTDRLDSEPPR